jgi:UDP-N-acetylmuramoyl-tripeptide--D-alanyl-D-alanine ligase
VIVSTLAEVADATGGTLVGGAGGGDLVTSDAVADSRQVSRGCLFVALPGTRVDGHAFAADALAAGAVAVLAAREVGGPAVLVEDPLAALGRLARSVVARLPDLTVVGVTGSVGKTSTKDLIAAVLAGAGPTVAPVGSFNNELGLPLTALRVGADTRFLVAEMGARGPGHIAHLCRITPPRLGVVLNVGAAHAGVFGSREATARAKGELVEALPEGGVAILNDDDPAVIAMASRTRADVLRFGQGSWADIRGDGPPKVAWMNLRLDGQARASFRLLTPLGEADVALRLSGRHHVGNALAAAAVGIRAGLPPARVADLLSAAEPASSWRMAVHHRADGVTVVNDAYNANPDSVRAALDAVAVMGGAGADQGPPRRRVWAVLGEMLELGDSSAAEHRLAGAYAARLGIDHIVAVGNGAGDELAAGAGERAEHLADAEEALDHLRRRVRPGDVVLVKASRAVGLETVGERLLADAGRAPAAGSGETA